MKDVIAMLRDLRRPRLLIRAARIGSEHYQASVHLPRLLGYAKHRGSTQTLLTLMEMEQTIDSLRREKSAAYDIARHVDVLAAMMAEAKALRLKRVSDEAPAPAQDRTPRPALHAV